MSHHYGEDTYPYRPEEVDTLTPIPRCDCLPAMPGEHSDECAKLLIRPGETETGAAGRRIMQREEARMSVNVKVSIPVTKKWRDSMKAEECEVEQDWQVTQDDNGRITLKGQGQEIIFVRSDLEAALDFLKPKKPAGPIYR